MVCGNLLDVLKKCIYFWGVGGRGVGVRGGYNVGCGNLLDDV